MRVGRLSRFATAVVGLELLLLPGKALAVAGSGTGGFDTGAGSGGDGDGGGFVGHGVGAGGAAGGGGSEELSASILAVAIVLGLLVLIYVLGGVMREHRSRRRSDQSQPLSAGLVLRTLYRVLLWPLDMAWESWALRARLPRVRLAAAEASLTDPSFDPDRVNAETERLFRAIQDAWSKDDRPALARLVTSGLMAEWEERLKNFARGGWRNEVEIQGPIKVGYVGLRHVADEQDRRVTVRLSFRARDIVVDQHGCTLRRRQRLTATHRVCEYWMLAPSPDGWILASIEQRHEGLHRLREPLLPSPSSDTETLQHDAMLEQVASSRVENSLISQIAGTSFAEDARAAALDLSMVDYRFSSRVLIAETERAVLTWAEAIDGADAPLGAVAGKAALDELLYPGDSDRRRRLVVRGPQVQAVRILAVHAHGTPPWMIVELRVNGHRYIEDRSSTTVVEGDRSTRASFTMRWRMELTDDNAHPWRIAQVQHAQPVSQ